MSKVVTMRTDKPHRCGKSVKIVGIDVRFDKLGFVDVMERHVEDLLKGGLEIVDEADLKKFAKQRELLEEAEKGIAAPAVDLHDENAKLKVENEGLKKANEVLQARIVELEALPSDVEDDKNEEGKDKKEDMKSVDVLNKTELIELCKEMEFPKKEWDKLGVDKLKAYVKSKL